MIHMGSMVGAGISQFQSKTLGISIPFFTRFRFKNYSNHLDYDWKNKIRISGYRVNLNLKRS